LLDKDLRDWANVIARGEAALRGPPEVLYEHWRFQAEDNEDEPNEDIVSLVPPQKKQRKQKQRESGVNIVVNPLFNVNLPGVRYS